MSKQVHFVVVADLDSETWWVDDEPLVLAFTRTKALGTRLLKNGKRQTGKTT